VFAGGKQRDFIGLAPLNPNTCLEYSGSGYNWTRNSTDILEDTKITTGRQIISKVDNFDISSKQSNRFISKGEKICKNTLEKLYGLEFKNERPKWMKNPETGARLELDCYNSKLNIAVEYNGIQHYAWPNFTNQTYSQFINQIRRDMLKTELCDNNNVYLITVPYNIPFNRISDFIKNNLPKNKNFNKNKIYNKNG
jgi:hypothetical protein